MLRGAIKGGRLGGRKGSGVRLRVDLHVLLCPKDASSTPTRGGKMKRQNQLFEKVVRHGS